MVQPPQITMKARVYQRGPNRFAVYLSWRGKPYWRTYYDHRFKLINRELADRLAGSINQDIDTKGKGFDPRQWFESKGFAFRSYADQWLKDHQNGYAPSVRRDVGRMVAAAQIYFEGMDIRSIRKGNIEDLIKQLPERFSPKTKKNYLITLHKVFSDALDREDIARIPGFPRIIVPEAETKWMSEADQEKVFEKIPAHDRPIFEFLAWSACRPGEARAMMWDMVDFEKGYLVIKRAFSGGILREYTKTYGIRYLPILEPMASILRGIRGIAGFVFRNRAGRPYQADISKIWNKACDDAGVQRIWLYQGTRHSRATQLIIAGKSPKLVRDLLGHSSQRTTDRYEKVAMEGMKTLLNLDRPSVA